MVLPWDLLLGKRGNPSLLNSGAESLPSGGIGQISKMLWAAACLALFAFLRVGEFTSSTTNKFDSNADLSISDVSVDNSCSPSMMLVHLKQSKTDQLRKRCCNCSWKDKQSSTVLSVCSVKLSGGKRRGLWSPINLELWSAEHFVAEVQKAHELSGVDSLDFSDHSFRIRASMTLPLMAFRTA